MAAQREPKVGRRPGNQDTRGQIITAARQAFAAKGFAGASMRGIAAEAGVDAALDPPLLRQQAAALPRHRCAAARAAGDRREGRCWRYGTISASDSSEPF